MSDQQFDQLRLELKEHLTDLFGKRFSILEKQIKSIQRSDDLIWRDLGDDRKNLGQIQISQGTIISQLKLLQDLLPQQTARISDVVEGHIDGMTSDVTRKVDKTTKSAVNDVLDEFTAGKPKVAKKEGLIARFKRFITRK